MAPSVEPGMSARALMKIIPIADNPQKTHCRFDAE
jgi:hypothetical protein